MEQEKSPLPSTVDKYLEAHYFLWMMAQQYHNPHTFRFNLNAFIQALRNITFMLQSERNKPAKFDEWYASRQEELRQDDLLRRFVEARNLVVKQETLATKSKAFLGVFRHRRCKLGLQGEVSPFSDSVELLERAKKFMVGFYIDEQHSSIGEEIGIQRTWIVEHVDDDDIAVACERALRKLGDLVARAHQLYDVEFDPTLKMPDVSLFRVITESDLDPSLPHKWGWVA